MGDGHPRIEGIALHDEDDFEAVAREALTGGFGSRGDDVDPAQGADHVYDALRALDSPFRDRFTRGLASCLTDPEPEVRHDALLFFENNPEAAGGERIDELVAASDRSLFRETVQGHPLEFSLLRALAARLRLGDGRALELARAEALAAGRADGVMAALAAHDAEWVLAHAEEIAAGSPGALGPMIRQLGRAGCDVVALCGRLARTATPGRDVVRRAVEQCALDAETKASILAALAR